MRLNFFILILLLFSSASVFSGANEDAKNFAKNMNDSVLGGIAENTDVNSIPNYQGVEVKEAAYYESGLGIEDQARAEAETNETATQFYEGIENRPSYGLNRLTDPLFINLETATANSHALTDTYSQCSEIPIGKERATRYREENCSIIGERTYSYFNCSKSRVVTCNGLTPKYLSTTSRSVCLAHGGSWDSGIRVYHPYSNYTWHTSRKDGKSRTYVKLYAGSGSVYAESHYNLNLSSLKVVRGNVHITVGSNYSSSTAGENNNYAYRAVGTVYGTPVCTLPQRCASFSDYSKWTCDGGDTRSGADLISSDCTSGPKTVTITGTNFYSDCWGWSEKYEREGAPSFTKEPYCAALEADSCYVNASKCINSNGEFCVEEKLDYLCPYEVAARNIMVCGEDLICPEGGCTADIGQERIESADDFKKAATAIEVAKNVSEEFNFDDLSVFKGEALSCKKSEVGFDDCCSGGGWGDDIGLASCSAEEEELSQIREAKRSHYVGSYCSEDSLFGCLTKKYVYCAFPSKLGRIITEQGKPQIGSGFGSAKEPNCDGFTLEQLESGLNFDQIDLSEFYGDTDEQVSSASTPNPSDLISRITDKIKNTQE